MLSINISLAMLQEAITDINPAGATFFNVSTSPYSKYVNNGELIVDSSLLPSDDAVETEISGNIFTDTYRSVKSWTQKTLAPLNFVANVFSQPYGFMRDIGIPTPISAAFGVLWYVIVLIIIVAWWTGK